ncbi:MAG: hypothetical protein KatS3mg014_2510 [Actinomycetota bacterium]|nr:MAG: hypothetical protein KatS3mg014_2495 [Actinomycetota bacterium]GIV00895.1 MAG: hypothetical protein KatS3mg014_2510 [Actinomycetota bacterium]
MAKISARRARPVARWHGRGEDLVLASDGRLLRGGHGTGYRVIRRGVRAGFRPGEGWVPTDPDRCGEGGR